MSSLDFSAKYICLQFSHYFILSLHMHRHKYSEKIKNNICNLIPRPKKELQNSYRGA